MCWRTHHLSDTYRSCLTGGPERLSRVDMANAVADTYDFDKVRGTKNPKNVPMIA